MIVNTDVALLLGYKKHCGNDGCKIWIHPSSFVEGNLRRIFHYGLPNFRKEPEFQLEILEWFRISPNRGPLTVRFEKKSVQIMQSHYFVKGETFSEAVWNFVSWILEHEKTLLRRVYN